MNIEADLKLAKSSLKKLNIEQDENRNRIQGELSEQLEHLARIAPLYDYQNVQENGYRASLYAVSKLIEYASELSNADDVDKVINFTKWFLRWTFKATEVNNNEPFPANVKDMYLYAYLQEFRDQKDNLRVVRREFPRRIWANDGSFQFLAKIMPYAIIANSKQLSWLQKLKCLFSTTTFEQTVGELVLTTDILVWRQNFDTLRLKPLAMIDKYLLRSSHRDVIVKEVFLDIQRKFQIELDSDYNVVFKKLDRAESKRVRCKVFTNSHSDLNRPQNLLMHSHGGGFFSLSIEAHETYLVEYAHSLVNTTLVSIEYPLSPENKFPAQLQRALDIYAHLLCDDKELFKTGINNIVLTGDSAGGNLSMTLTFAVEDIRRIFDDEHTLRTIRLPREVHLIFPALTSESNKFTPSQLMTCMDSLPLPPCLAISAAKAICPFEVPMSDEEWFDEKRIAAKHELLMFYEKSFLAKSRYTSPLMTDGPVQGVELSVVTTNMCPFFDHSIQLCKKWPGARLDIVDRLPHGYIMMSRFTQQTSDALDVTIDHLKRALDS